MPLSNTTQSILAASPYWDDFDRAKRYHQILFRPSTPVQVRELNQIQSLLQNQVEQLGAGVFKEGAAVTGGNFTFANNVQALQFVRDDAVDISNFYDDTTGLGAVVRGRTSLAEAHVVQITLQPTENYSAAIIAPMTANTFTAAEFVDFVDAVSNSSIATMTLAPAPVYLKNAAMFSVDSGTFFLRGRLVDVVRQSLILSSNSNVVTARLGFVISEDIVTSTEDASLLDPALGSTNYAAPGAHRLKLTGTLTSRPIAGTSDIEKNADENFIEIARVIDGVLVQPSDRTVPTLLEDTMARRTYDESGDYVVRPFKLKVVDHNPPVNFPNANGTITGNTSSNIILGAGVATYFQSEISANDIIEVNGEQRTVTAVLSNTALTVNSAFSTPFTNVSFVVVSPNKLTLELDAGKAYVRGYEFETLGTTKLEALRPRTTANAVNEDIGTFFGPYLIVQRGTSGAYTAAQSLPNITSTPQVDLHNVSFPNISNVTSIYAATKIGTAYLRGLTYLSGTGDANTLYKMYLVNAEFANKIYPVGAASPNTAYITSVVANSLNKTLTILQDGTGANQSVLPIVNGAFTGAKVILKDIYGGNLEYYVTDTVVVAPTNPDYITNVVCTLSSNGFLDLVNATANVTFVYTDRCIRGVSAFMGRPCGATIAALGKANGSDTGNTVVYGSDQTATVFPLRHAWAKANTFSDENYQTVRWFNNVAGTSFGGNTTHLKFTLTVNTNEEFYPVSTIQEFLVSNSSGYTVPLNSNGSYTASYALTSQQVDLYLQKSPGVDSNTISVLARVSVNTTNPKTKTLYFANTTLTSVSAHSVNATGYLVSNVTETLTKTDFLGHIGINKTNASLMIYSLGTPDVYKIQKVYAVTNANSTTTGFVDVTNRYELDNGQRTWCYDHASLVLKPGYSHYNANQMLVMADVFIHSTSNGFFTGESYRNSGLTDDYADIPVFTDPKSGQTYPLRDCVDFRPVRTVNVASANTATNPYVGVTATFGEQLYPFPDGTFQCDYEYYLPRVDKIILTKDKLLKVATGQPALNPIAPADDQDGITLYTVNYPAYVANTTGVQFQAYEYRRYTMKDIGKLQKRIENLEYYVQLSVVETQTLNTPEFAADDVTERFKNGILVDSFMSAATADLADDDFYAAIDPINRELRPVGETYIWNAGGYDAATSTNTQKTGDLITASYTTTSFINQPLASKSVNINPFNVASWYGKIKLTPEVDTWFDTVNVGNINVNLFDPNDTWTEKSLGTTWNNWETNWTGKPSGSSWAFSFGAQVYGVKDPRAAELGRTRDRWIDINEQQTTYTGLTTRSGGVETFAQATTYSAEVGERTLDMSISQFMRAANVTIEATGLKPGAALVGLFDGQDVTGLIERANEIVLSSNAAASSFVVGETITSNAGTTGTATIAGITANILRVVNASGVFFTVGQDTLITGTRSLATATTTDYKCYSGKLTPANTTTIVLDAGASTVDSTYTGLTIAFTSAAGERRVIASYVGSTRTATLASPISGLTTGSTYTIGPLVVDGTKTAVQGIIASANSTSIYFAGQPDAQLPGRFYGLFRLPAGRFAVGSRTLRLTDNTSSEFLSTAAEGIFQASGYTRRVSTVTATTREIGFTTRAVANTTVSAGSFNVTSTSAEVGGWIDPLAQTFLIDGTIYSEGVYVTSVDLYFAKKDQSNLPVTVQIRPTVNGYPSADILIAEKQLPGDAISVVPDNTTPNPSTASHRTRFTFDHPVYLLPNQEYALVILSNSFVYEVFVGEIGKQIIGDTRVIAQQPYGGSFFKSQNARTWTPEQNEDLMFTINRAVFSTSSAEARFFLGETPTADFVYDLYNFQPDQITHAATRPFTAHLTRVVDNTSKDLESFTQVPTAQNVELPARKLIRSGNTQSLIISAALTTNSDAVSPVYDTQTMKYITVKNVIGNGELHGNAFTVMVQGTMTSPSATNCLLTLSSNVGSGAIVYANTNSTGYITSFYVANTGSGYTDAVTVTSVAEFSVQPTITYHSETSNKVGMDNTLDARYITKRVTLADGFDANDIKVYFSAYRPNNTNIDVYYKILGTGDTDYFDNRPWTRMIIKPEQASVFSHATGNYREYEYRTSGNTASYVSNSVTYDTFHTFAVKLVLRSTTPSVVPKVKNLRVIALDDYR